jgi:predicted HAD superfamily Cof-like phosphohydrolase
MVREFHLAAGVEMCDEPRATLPRPANYYNQESREFHRYKLLLEELTEYLEGLWEEDIVKLADGLADVMYIAIGTAIIHGIPIDMIFEEVHRSNMTKIKDGKVTLRADGKILKPDTYEPPQIAYILSGDPSDIVPTYKEKT